MNLGLPLIFNSKIFVKRRLFLWPFDTPIHSPLGFRAMNRENLIRDLRAIVGERYLLVEKEDVVVYEQDGSIFQVMPEIVALPGNVDEVVAVVKAAKQAGVPIVPRGSGTGLAGGAVPAEGGIVLSLARLNRILKIDLENRLAIVEPGVINVDVTKAVAKEGLFYAPDPSSQAACSIGGNVANNSGGPHTLAYGVTTNHVLGVEVVLDDGSVIWLGGELPDMPGYDLCGLFVGSEGTLGVVTKVIVRLMRARESVRTLLAIFDRMDDATETVVDITAAGIIPAALEMMDRTTIEAIERGAPVGFPRDAEAVLLVEVEGLREHTEQSMTLVSAICQQKGAREVRVAKDETERQRLMERPQRRLRRHGYPGAELLRPGRRRAAQQAAGNDAAHRRDQQSNSIFASPMSFMPATAICIPTFSSTCAHPAKWTGSSKPAPRPCAPASSSAAASPANMASGWKRKLTSDCCSTRRT